MNRHEAIADALYSAIERNVVAIHGYNPEDCYGLTVAAGWKLVEEVAAELAVLPVGSFELRKAASETHPDLCTAIGNTTAEDILGQAGLL